MLGIVEHAEQALALRSGVQEPLPPKRWLDDHSGPVGAQLVRVEMHASDLGKPSGYAGPRPDENDATGVQASRRHKDIDVQAHPGR